MQRFTRLRFLLCPTLVVALLSATHGGTPLFAQTAAATPSPAFTKFLNDRDSYRPKTPTDSQWLEGGDRYTVLQPSTANKDAMDLVAFDTETGERTILVSAKEFVPKGAQKALEVESYSWSTDQKQLLIFTNSRRVWRENTRGDYWVLTLADGKLQKLGVDAPESTLMFAKFAPDGRSVAYARQNNLYVEELATGRIRPLTSDGSTDILNGTSDWVNEEELSLRDCFRWSPDSRSIAYWQFNESGVQDYTLIDDTAERYPQTSVYKYPQVGLTNSAVRVGVVPAEGGPTRWIKLPGDPRNHYIPRMDWVGDGDEIAVEFLNRKQNDDQLYLVDGRSGNTRMFFEESDPDYVDILASIETFPHLRWLRSSGGSKDLLWLSDRDGWLHAYRISHATGQARLLTPFDGDIIAFVGADEAAGDLYFTASPSDPVRAYLYRSRLDGTGSVERVSAAAVGGTSSYDASPNGRWAIRNWSSTARPDVYSLVRLRDDTALRVLEDNDALFKKLQPLLEPHEEFLETSIGDGTRLSTSLIKPPDFDPRKKYPVITYVYGEPFDATVKDSYSLSTLYLRAMSREGYVVLSFDNVGTPEPKGRAWRKAGYGAIGVLSSQQQAEAIRAFARTHAYIDTSRMAIWGWSGGGTNTLNMMFRYPDLYSTGVAVAPVPDQTRYDTIYQERYMGLPTENAKGYHDGSAINFADGLKGHLLLIHGSGDDNVHFQGSELLVNKLIELGKPFDLMDYPNRSHGIFEGPGTTKHLFSLIMRYIEQHVPPGPKEAASTH